MSETTNHLLILSKNKVELRVALSANDNNHAQAQASDIARVFEPDKFYLVYEETTESTLSTLFCKLAFNDFKHSKCTLWDGSLCNNAPCLYAFNKRFYIRDIILKYLDIPRESYTPKASCKNPACINPYHFSYVPGKNTKISGGDLELLLAYRRQGACVQQLAEVFKVHRSTIYRKLKDERFHPGSSSDC